MLRIVRVCGWILVGSSDTEVVPPPGGIFLPEGRRGYFLSASLYVAGNDRTSVLVRAVVTLLLEGAACGCTLWKMVQLLGVTVA